MSYKIYKIKGKEPRPFSEAVVEIITNNPSLTTNDIETTISNNPYKSRILDGVTKKPATISRMGLHKCLTKTLSNDVVSFKDESGKTRWKVLPKSAILSKINGDNFRRLYNFGLDLKQDEVLEELSKSGNKGVDTLLKYVGLHVIGTVIAGEFVLKESRKNWLKSALDLNAEGAMDKKVNELLHDDNLKIFLNALKKDYKLCSHILDETGYYSEEMDSLYKENMFQK